MKMQLAILTRSFDFSQRFFLSFLFIFFSFFLSFLFIFFSLSLFQEKRFVKPLYVQRWLAHRMTNRHRRYPALGKRLFMIRHHHCGQTSLWIGFTVGNGVRSPRRASNRQSGPERLLLPFPIGSFFPPVSRAPQPFPSFSLLFSYSVGSIDASRTNSKRYVRLFKEMMVERKNFHRDTNFFFF